MLSVSALVPFAGRDSPICFPETWYLVLSRYLSLFRGCGRWCTCLEFCTDYLSIRSDWVPGTWRAKVKCFTGPRKVGNSVLRPTTNGPLPLSSPTLH